MTVLYPIPCYKEACYKGTVLYLILLLWLIDLLKSYFIWGIFVRAEWNFGQTILVT